MTQNINKKLLDIGLSPDQAATYTVLLSHGTATVRKIALDTGITRTLVYKIMRQLVSLSLAEELQAEGTIARFRALHPSHLDRLVSQKTEEATEASKALSDCMSDLISTYNISHDKPSMRLYEGIRGLKALYKDINLTGQPISLLRSPLDDDSPELAGAVKEQLSSQKERGISARVIVPAHHPYTENKRQQDIANLVERRRAPAAELDLSAQFVVYGEKVGITSFGGSMITTIIQDKRIAESFLKIFDALWEKYKDSSPDAK